MTIHDELTDALVSTYLRHLEDVLRGRDKGKAIESFNEQCCRYLSNISQEDLTEVHVKISELSASLLNAERDPKPPRHPLGFSFRKVAYGVLAIALFSASLFVSFSSQQSNSSPIASKRSSVNAVE